jgi:hypothetical protein
MARLSDAFDTARDHQRRAWEMYYKRQFRPALKMSLQAEKSLEKITDLIRAKSAEINREQNQLNQFYMQLTKARLIAADCNHEQSGAILSELEQAYNQCQLYARENASGKFEQTIKQARQQYRRLISLCGGGEELKGQIDQLRAKLERLQANGAATDPQIVRLLKSAREHIAAAEQQCADGNEDICAGHLKAAQLNLRKVKDLLEL